MGLFLSPTGSSSAGMNLLVQAFKSFAGNVGIDLRAGQIGMPQHNLNTAEIRAVFQQMGRKRMPQSVW